MIEALFLAIGLATDASAVAAARGAASRSLWDRDLVLLPLLFGGFQAAMSALGWRGAAWSLRYIDSWDHWLAFGLLVAIGVKMLRDAVRGDGNQPASGDERPAPRAPRPEPTPGADPAPSPSVARRGLWIDLSLAVATSLDAAAAGVSLPSVPFPPLGTVALIGCVTAALSAVGFAIGWRIGARFGRAAIAVGGLVLIGIGARLLWAA
jgi:manganese efflux pump family protein